MKGYTTRTTALFAALMLSLLAAAGALASDDRKTLLIINSYHESEPWVGNVVQPLILKQAELPGIKCEMVSLNNAVLADTAEFRHAAAGIIDDYSAQHPSYVVMIGSLAFAMRETIQQHWGDIPMLLINTSSEYATPEEFFRPSYSVYDASGHHSIKGERDKYNFTAVILPEYYRETVDMMMELKPGMTDLVFMADTVYDNRRLAHNIKTYLTEEYPGVHFKWLKASLENADTFHDYLTEPQPRTGLLMSSWAYDRKDFNGMYQPSRIDIRYVSASKNPIFSMHESSIPTGVVGGVSYDPETARQKIAEVLQAMVAGEDMRKIPIYEDKKPRQFVNHRLLRQYKLDDDVLADDVVKYSEHITVVRRYEWQIAVVLLLLLLAVVYFGNKSRMQHKKLAAMQRNREFIDNMPVPYSTATVMYSRDGKVWNIDYQIKNDAFGKIIDDNFIDGSPQLLFPSSYIAPKVEKLLQDKQMQTFVYFFAKTHSYYEFIMCLVNTDPTGKGEKKHRVDIFAIDITARIRMEKKLENSAKKLGTALSISKLVPWQYDVRKDIVTRDTFVTKIVDSKTEVQSLEDSFDFATFTLFAHPDDRELLNKLIRDVRAGQVKDIDLQFRRVSDDDRDRYEWYHLTGAATEYDEYGFPVAYMGVNTNIDERVASQATLTRALEHAKESDRMKSAFLATMSHEIRTPLNAIVGFSNVLAHIDDPAERLQYCDIINKNNDQLLALVNDMLDLAKIESNALAINISACDVNEVLDQVHKSMEMKMPQDVELFIRSGAKKCIAMVDQMRLIQVLNNLVSNAIKFTKRGNVTIGYDIADNKNLYFYVRDTGVGIEKADQEKIFDRFVKLDKFVPGTGLGLSIVKHLVEHMGGKVGVDSSGAGRGSTFWFTIPYTPAN